MNESRDIIIEPGDLRVIGHGSVFVHWDRDLRAGDPVIVLSIVVEHDRCLLELLAADGLIVHVDILLGGSIERFLVRPR